MKQLWFKAKRYGWGWYPCTWQGWMIVVVFALAIAFDAALISVGKYLLIHSLILVVLGHYFFIAVIKLEKNHDGDGETTRT